MKDFKGHDPHFIAYLLETLRLKRFDTGAANPTLNRNIVHAEMIAFPAKQEQEAISSALAVIEQKVRVRKQKQSVLQDLFRVLLHELMTAKIRITDLNIMLSEGTLPGPVIKVLGFITRH